MNGIQFDKKQTEALVEKLRDYFEQELNQELGQFDAEFLLDFISKEFGAHYYNQGLNDARALLEQKIDMLTEGFYELEQMTS